MPVQTTLERGVHAVSSTRDNWTTVKTQTFYSQTPVKGTFMMVITDLNNFTGPEAYFAAAAYISELNGQTYGPDDAPRFVESNAITSITGSLSVQACDAKAQLVGLLSDTNLY